MSSELSKTTAGVSSSVEEQQSFSKHHFFFGWPVAAFLTVLHYFFDTVLLNSEFLFSCMLPQFTCHDFVLPFLFALCNVASQYRIERNGTVSRSSHNSTVPFLPKYVSKGKNVQRLKFSRNAYTFSLKKYSADASFRRKIDSSVHKAVQI